MATVACQHQAVAPAAPAALQVGRASVTVAAALHQQLEACRLQLSVAEHHWSGFSQSWQAHGSSDIAACGHASWGQLSGVLNQQALTQNLRGCASAYSITTPQ
jgi:hypothetical protein